MLLLLLIGLILCGTAVALIVRAVTLPRMRAAATVERVGSYGFPAAEAPAPEAGRLTAALDQFAERLGAAMLPRLSGGDDAQVRTLLVSAGMYGTSPGKFLGYRTLSAITFTGLWMWMGSAGFGPAPFLLITVIVALIGWTIPLSLLRVRSQRRLEAIDYELPQLIDSLVVTVEAGLGFNGALRMAARELRGPCGDEIQLTLQEQSMGLTMKEALENMSERVDLPSMRSFVRSVIQGESLGVSIGEIMRALAVEMRARRRAKAEERAQKAPIKMLFPLAFLIFPAMLIVLLFPAVNTLTETFSG